MLRSAVAAAGEPAADRADVAQTRGDHPHAGRRGGDDGRAVRRRQHQPRHEGGGAQMRGGQGPRVAGVWRRAAGRAPDWRAYTAAAFSAPDRSMSVADASGHQKGGTRMPFSTATLTAVVNDSTSTVTRQAASMARRLAPAVPTRSGPRCRTGRPGHPSRFPLARRSWAAQPRSGCGAALSGRLPRDGFSRRVLPQRGQLPSGPTAVGRRLRRQAGHLSQATPKPRSGVILTRPPQDIRNC